MSAKNQLLKDPDSSVAGNHTSAPQNLHKEARKWEPHKSGGTSGAATLARYAMRLIDLNTAKAYSFDELMQGGLQAGATTSAADSLAIPVTYRAVDKTTGADAEALTLADGRFVGQRLNIRLVTDGGGDGTLTPTTADGFATIVFADAGDFVELEWNASGWRIIGVGGLLAQPTVTV